MRKRGVVAAVLLTVPLALEPPSAARAAEAVVGGCSEMNPGEVGIRELVADVGDTVGVAVTVHTVDPLDSFSLDIDFPSALLSFVRAEAGDLTGHFLFFGGSYLTNDDQVRLSGTEIESPVPAGREGVLGVVWFEVVASGSGDFSTGEYLDDLSSYVSCEEGHGTSPVAPESLGSIKASYR